MKPNFLFIGPDKSGSTWIYSILRQHPECYIPRIKEIFFFDTYYETGIKWYMSFFKNAPKNVKAVGEICHNYLSSELAAERIFNDLPGVKQLCCLRNPVERSFSNYLFLVRNGLTRASFEEALDAFPELIDGSLYYKNLLKYYSIFNPSQIKVLLFSKLVKNPKEFAREMFDFLNINFDDSIEYDKKVLPASKPRSYYLAKIIKLGAVQARKMRMERLLSFVKEGFIPNILYKPYDSENKPKMKPETAEKLRLLFREDILATEKLLNRDLSCLLD